MKKQGIRQKLSKLILIIVVVVLIAEAAGSIISMMNMRQKALETATSDAVERLAELASDRAELADSMLRIAQNQTLLVKEGAEEIIGNAEKYLLGYHEDGLPDLACADEERHLINVAVPEEFLKNVEKNEDGALTYAELDRTVPTGGKFTVNEELYLGSLLINEFSQIYHFRTEGTEDEYKGFAASYFCFADTGFYVIGDPKLESTALIACDGRTRGWYVGTLDGYNNGKLSKAGVFWSEPIQDAAGRGTSMVCAAPIIVNGEVVGVAGSGGLINDFADLVKSSTLGSTGFSFMVSRSTGKVAINPNDTATASKESEVMAGTDLTQSKNEALVKLAKTVCDSKNGNLDTIRIDGTDCYLSYSALENNDWTMVTVISKNDDLIMQGYNKLNDQIRTAFIVFFAIFAVLVLVSLLVANTFSKRFTTPIIKLKDGVDTIGSGNLNHVIDIKTNDEIEDLGNAFNEMTHSLNDYINNLAAVTAEKERIGAELDVAAHIQASMLPCIFPAFPERKEFDIYATMNPAKEVGGDFYDFFMVDERHLAIVVADVSGKGVPAALFMVIGKTLIKDHTVPGCDLGTVFSEVNNLLCQANSEGLFITAFEGVLDLVTGEFQFVNAGHEMPYIYHKGGDFEFKKVKAAFVLSGMEDMKYHAGSIMLEEGDKIFQYTDGVTEATDANNQLYGMERLTKILNTVKEKRPDEILPAVKADIDKFVGEAPQFDDITMLGLEFKEKMKE